jgi:hypothetical protein
MAAFDNTSRMGTPPLGRRPRRRLQKLINRVLPR